MKVVINKCFGGFGISVEALKELAIRNAKCIETCTPKHYYGGDNEKFRNKSGWEKEWKKDFADYKDLGDGFMGHNYGYNLFKDELLYSLKDRGDIEVRTDKDLIEVVEKMGEKSYGQCANLEIVEIPDGIDYEIDDYDGMERIAEKHRTWG